MILKKILLILFVFSFSSVSYSASMNMIGEKGDPNKVDRIIEIEMHDNYYYPENIDVKRGETIKFIVKNLGNLVHEYNIGTKEMHIKHQPEMMMMVENEILLSDRVDKEKMKQMAKKAQEPCPNLSFPFVVKSSSPKHVYFFLP